MHGQRQIVQIRDKGPVGVDHDLPIPSTRLRAGPSPGQPLHMAQVHYPLSPCFGPFQGVYQLSQGQLWFAAQDKIQRVTGLRADVEMGEYRAESGLFDAARVVVLTLTANSTAGTVTNVSTLEVAHAGGIMHRDLKALANSPFDLLVIGGGIFGAGIARDAAQRGLRLFVDGLLQFGALAEEERDAISARCAGASAVSKRYVVAT